MKATPYNTGKLLIGCNYTPPIKTYAPSRDQITLQTALLQAPGRGPGLLGRVVRAFWRWA